MSFIVEQVEQDGSLVMDYDQTLSVRRLYEIILQTFPNIYKDTDGMICGEYRGKHYSIRVKNVSYLGNPHPLYKKRIQIPKDIKDFYVKSIKKGCKPLLLGIYTYHKTVLFCEFNIEDYVGKKAHNSSAHIYSSDLAEAVMESYFQKDDYFGNRITVFSENVVEVFLGEIFREETSFLGEIKMIEDYSAENGMQQKNVEKFSTKDILLFFKFFFGKEEKIWRGKDCYQKMMDAHYRNCFQPEWPGFYLEFEVENSIRKYKAEKVIQYAQDKKRGGIDLDLYFPIIDCYGDLKAHSEGSRGVQGNDWDTIFSLLEKNSGTQHIYYIVCEHSTVRDKDCNYEVTEFWNKARNKENLKSYAGRMKNCVELKRWYLLDINQRNVKYLTKFRQGINSNGKPRKPKIMIEKTNFDKFVIADFSL